MIGAETLEKAMLGFAGFARKRGLRISTSELGEVLSACRLMTPLTLEELGLLVRLCMGKSPDEQALVDRLFRRYFYGHEAEAVALRALLFAKKLRRQKTGPGGKGAKDNKGQEESSREESGQEEEHDEKGQEDQGEDGERRLVQDAAGDDKKAASPDGDFGAVSAEGKSWRQALAERESLPDSLRRLAAGERFRAAAVLAKEPLTVADKYALTKEVFEMAAEGILGRTDQDGVVALLKDYAGLAQAVERARASSQEREEDVKGSPRAPSRVPDLPAGELGRLSLSRKLSEDQVAALRREVRLSASRLRLALTGSAGMLKRHKAIDFRRTMRASLAGWGEPFWLAWRAKRRKLRKLVTVCDVSGSMRRASELLLTFVYELHQAFSGRAQHFVFVGLVDEVTPFMAQGSLEDWLEQAVGKAAVDYLGFSDYGHALRGLDGRYGAAFDSDTVVLLLGDARTNRKNPEVDRLRSIRQRAHQVFLLNPEEPAKWDTGDSVVSAYRRVVDEVVDISQFGKFLAFVRRLPDLVVR